MPHPHIALFPFLTLRPPTCFFIEKNFAENGYFS